MLETKNRSNGAVFGWANPWLHLDFDVAPSGQAQVHQAVDSLGGRFKYVNKAFVNAHFELFTAFFIHVWAFYYRKGTATSWQWDGSCQARAGAQSGVHNLLGSLVDDFVIVGLEANTNTLLGVWLYV